MVKVESRWERSTTTPQVCLGLFMTMNFLHGRLAATLNLPHLGRHWLLRAHPTQPKEIIMS